MIRPVSVKAAPTSPVRRATAPIKPFDDELAAALEAGHLRLLDASLMRRGGLPAFVRRQDIEEKPRMAGRIFLSPEAACEALRSADRRVCFVTHAWRHVVNPDPGGATLRALLRFLCDEIGEYIVGVFVDFTCLHQPPRTADQEASYQQALAVLANGFASPLGTMVARFDTVPPCPPKLAHTIAVLGAPRSAGGAVNRVLGSGPTGRNKGDNSARTVKACEFDDDHNVWRAEMDSAAGAAAALAAVDNARPLPSLPSLPPGARACRWYNETTFSGRGWCSLEFERRDRAGRTHQLLSAGRRIDSHREAYDSMA